MRKRELTHDEFMRELRRQVDVAGSQKAFAGKHGISAAFLSDILADRRDPGKKLLDSMGYEKHILYRWVK